MDLDQVVSDNRERNLEDPSAAAFLKDLIAVFSKHGRAIDRLNATGPMAITHYDGDSNEFYEGAIDTTAPGYEGQA